MLHIADLVTGLLTNFGFDTAENEPAKKNAKLQILQIPQIGTRLREVIDKFGIDVQPQELRLSIEDPPRDPLILEDEKSLQAYNLVSFSPTAAKIRYHFRFRKGTKQRIDLSRIWKRAFESIQNVKMNENE